MPNQPAGYEPDLVKRLCLIAVNWESVAPGTMREAVIDAKGEIARLQEAKRRALAIADERSRENVALRAEIEKLRADLASIRSVYDFAALEARIVALRAALKPFAALATHYPMAQKYGNRPRSGDIHSVSSGGMPDASITVENVHMAAAALASEQRVVEK